HQRMAIVEPCIDAGAKYFFFQLVRVGKCVRRIRDCTADDQSYFARAEETFQSTRDRASNASVCGWKFRVMRRGSKRCTCGVSNGQGVLRRCGVPTGRHRPPEAEMVLGVHTADERVSEASPQHGEQSRCIRSVERTGYCQRTKGSRVLSARVLGPEQANLGLRRSPHGTVDRAQSLNLVEIVSPFLASQIRWRFIRKQLRGVAHGQGLHMSNPGGLRSKARRWSRNPNAGRWHRGIGIRYVHAAAVARSDSYD